MAIWKDLVGGDGSTEARKSALELLRARIKQPGTTPLERRQLFESIITPGQSEDFQLQFTALTELTHDGKDLTTFQDDIMPLITGWLIHWFQKCGEARDVRRKEKDRNSRTSGRLVEENNLNSIYGYVVNMVRFSCNGFQETEIILLLEQLLRICRKTTASSDIKSVMQIMDALVTYGEMPRAMLDPCLDVLCGAYGMVKDVADPIWNTIRNLCKSHTAQNAVTALMDILRSPSGHDDRNTNTLRGAILLLKRIWCARGMDGIVTLSSAAVLNAFHLCLAADSSRLELEIVDTILEIVEQPSLTDAIVQDGDWTILMNVLSQCSRRTIVTKKAQSRRSSDRSSDRSSKANEACLKTIESLKVVIGHLERYCCNNEFEHRSTIMEFFMAVPRHLPHSTAELLVKYHTEERLCYPSNQAWLIASQRLISTFFEDVTKPPSIRQLVLQEIREVYQMVMDQFDSETILQLVEPFLKALNEESDREILDGLRALAVDVAGHSEDEISDKAMAALAGCFTTDRPLSLDTADDSDITTRPRSGFAAKQTNNYAMDAATTGLATVFVKCLGSAPAKAQRCYELLLKAAGSRHCDARGRISALKVLFRLHSNASGAIYLTNMAECEALAATLGRTSDSQHLLRSNQEPTRNRQSRQEKSSSQSGRGQSAAGHTKSTSSSQNRASEYAPRSMKVDPCWMYQEEHSESGDATSPLRTVLSCRSDTTTKTDTESSDNPTPVLNIKLWLEVLISILQQEDDWEVYSYVLVHLAAQLSNHSLFVEAVPQLQLLRNVLCEQLRVSSFREPPLSSSLKKQDVTICLFHTLTILLTYHQHFSKNEQDEIIRTFVNGVGSGERTAKYCIHALAICCHELPLSISKSLNNILQKMSQIITQSQVAVHVLEFLAGLARMPEVYVNFRDDDYRTVFGVCFRYLQYVRDQRQRGSDTPLARPSTGSESHSRKRESSGPVVDTLMMSSGGHELPQYVYALAYHVITYWFMSVKLVDRAKYTSWITKNLVLVDASGREVIEEQSQVTIDMMQRVTYSDHDETLPDPRFAGTPDEPMSKKSWLVGMSILTVETAMHSGTSQLTKRQPSATTYWTYKSTVAQRPLHQIPIRSQLSADANDENSRIEVLPHHILLQLVSSSWRTPTSMRPVPLPGDEATSRAISIFDRNTTVDGHKVGVIYIGPGQKTEAEILSNTVGSDEFTEFLTELGTLIRLKGAKFNTQGLDREMDMDGQYTFCWRDRVTELVFHIPVMMPTDKERDPQCINKKRHTGNDFVNIIFNDSGSAFRFDTFPSEFNYVNIVITPEAGCSAIFDGYRRHAEPHQRFYKVQVMSKPGFPQVSPAADVKVLSGKSLPDFVRLVALNASVFSLVWANRDGGEYVSSWRNRLREINRLRDKYAPGTQMFNPVASPTTVPGSAGGIGGVSSSGREAMTTQRESMNFRRTSGPGFFSEGISSHRSSVLSTAATATETDAGGYLEEECLADS